jgi:hypothetical protein
MNADETFQREKPGVKTLGFHFPRFVPALHFCALFFRGWSGLGLGLGRALGRGQQRRAQSAGPFPLGCV